MYNDSNILKLTVFLVESVIEKLSALTCSQCSLIAEWGGAVKGRPVRQEIHPFVLR